VTQALVESPEIIYNTLIADPVISPLVGTYHFADGTTEDSISVMSPGQELPRLKKVTGLEIIIHDVAQVSSHPYLTNQSDVISVWRVYLIAWPGSDGSILNNVVRQIVKRFGHVWTIEVSARGAPLGALTQSLIMIRSTSVVLPA
jgi:hypothetical protein